MLNRFVERIRVAAPAVVGTAIQAENRRTTLPAEAFWFRPRVR
jgi:hypothetical protein